MEANKTNNNKKQKKKKHDEKQKQMQKLKLSYTNPTFCIIGPCRNALSTLCWSLVSKSLACSDTERCDQSASGNSTE
jgi:hypothetical protein